MITDFALLMNSVYSAHSDFHAVWRRYYVNTSKPEPAEVTKTRDYFFVQLNRLFDEIGKYEKDFFENKSYAIDAVLGFLETDIPAFRCGYAKEKFFRRLKSMSLNPNQEERIRNLAYNQCKTDYYRREFRDLARLMIKIADREFIEKIGQVEKDSNGIIKFKSRLMLQTILQNRKDLN